MKKELNFNEWASMMLEVYKEKDNGHWAVIMSILAVFKSHISKEQGYFTSLFLSGFCGKTELAKSISAVVNDSTQCLSFDDFSSDLNFYNLLKQNGIVICEGYRDNTISNISFVNLITFFDGHIYISKSNAVPLLIGHEKPKKDEYSLANRLIVLQLNKIDYTKNEFILFKELKEYEKDGLQDIQNEIFNIKDIVYQHYSDYFESVRKQIFDIIIHTNIRINYKVVNSVCLFTAMVKLIEEQQTTIKLPFTYTSFFNIAISYIINDSVSK